MTRKKQKRDPEHIPFEHLKVCPFCGSTSLKIVHDRKYPEKEGIYRFVIYRCHHGHEFHKRQLVVRIFNPAWLNTEWS